MEKEMLVVGMLKDGMFEKFMGFMQSDAGMEERKKIANVPKTIASVSPDKKVIMFKIFVHDEDALHNFFENNEVSKPIVNETMDSYTIYNLSKV